MGDGPRDGMGSTMIGTTTPFSSFPPVGQIVQKDRLLQFNLHCNGSHSLLLYIGSAPPPDLGQIALLEPSHQIQAKPKHCTDGHWDRADFCHEFSQ